MNLEKEVASLKKKLKEAELTIARSRNRDSLARQAAKIGYWDFTPSTGHLQWSPEVLNLVAGLPSGEIDTSYENFTKFIHKDDLDQCNKIVSEAVENSLSFQIFYRVIHEDKSIHWLRGWGGPVEGEKSEIRMIGAVMDVTAQKNIEMELKIAKNTAEEALIELKKTQSQIIQSEKMATIGQLTAGVAHELNNPINFISNGAVILNHDFENLIELLDRYEQLSNEPNWQQSMNNLADLKEELDVVYLKENIAQTLKDIQMGANRTVKIIKGLLSFSRIEVDPEKKILYNIHTGLDDTLSILNARLKKKVVVIKKYDKSIRDIFCFPGQLNQVLMNLIINSEQAIEERGTITIITKSIGDKIRINIKDDGIGIDEKIINRLFEPFFTTKAIGVGTGLGLYISYGIIKKHNGEIEVNSEFGKGCEFTITLPIK